jgi:hypothetical protein
MSGGIEGIQRGPLIPPDRGRIGSIYYGREYGADAEFGITGGNNGGAADFCGEKAGV